LLPLQRNLQRQAGKLFMPLIIRGERFMPTGACAARNTHRRSE